MTQLSEKSLPVVVQSLPALKIRAIRFLADEAPDFKCYPHPLRQQTIKYDKRRYKRRNRIEIMFGRLKDWRRVATRYDRCPMAFLSAIALAATVIFWL